VSTMMLNDSQFDVLAHDRPSKELALALTAAIPEIAGIYCAVLSCATTESLESSHLAQRCSISCSKTCDRGGTCA
jgi:hypothetical protein